MIASIRSLAVGSRLVRKIFPPVGYVTENGSQNHVNDRGRGRRNAELRGIVLGANLLFLYEDACWWWFPSLVSCF